MANILLLTAGFFLGFAVRTFIMAYTIKRVISAGIEEMNEMNKDLDVMLDDSKEKLTAEEVHAASEKLIKYSQKAGYSEGQADLAFEILGVKRK